MSRTRSARISAGWPRKPLARCKQLGLGRWDSLVVEAQHATVALAPGLEGAVVMVAAARDTQVGLVRRLLAQARQRATTWMGMAA